MPNVINTGSPYAKPAGFTQTTTPGGGTAWRDPSSGLLYTETSPGTFTEAPYTLETQYRGSGGQVSPLSGQVEVQPSYANPATGYTSQPSAVIQPSGLTKYVGGVLVDATTERPVEIQNGKYVYTQAAPQQAPSPTGQPGVDGNTGNIFSQLQQYIQSSGYQVPQGGEITPELATEFMSRAQSEIHPYYASQLKIAKDSLLTSLGYTADQIAQQERQTALTYGKNLRSLSENAAERGFAQSGLRQRDEQELASQTQLTLDSTRSASLQGALQKAQSFAQQYGGNMADVPQRYIPGAATVTPGMETLSRGADSPLYSLSSDVYSGLTGEKQFDEQGYTLNRARSLESDYRSLGANTANRNLTFGTTGTTTPSAPSSTAAVTSPYRQLYL